MCLRGTIQKCIFTRKLGILSCTTIIKTSFSKSIHNYYQNIRMPPGEYWWYISYSRRFFLTELDHISLFPNVQYLRVMMLTLSTRGCDSYATVGITRKHYHLIKKTLKSCNYGSLWHQCSKKTWLKTCKEYRKRIELRRYTYNYCVIANTQGYYGDIQSPMMKLKGPVYVAILSLTGIWRGLWIHPKLIIIRR